MRCESERMLIWRPDYGFTSAVRGVLPRSFVPCTRDRGVGSGGGRAHGRTGLGGGDAASEYISHYSSYGVDCGPVGPDVTAVV